MKVKILSKTSYQTYPICNEMIEVADDILKRIGIDLQFTDKLGNVSNYTNLSNEIIEIKKWYDTYYTTNEQKYRRLHTLGKLTDEGKDPYNELINLYSEAEIKRARIQELERLLSDSSK